MRTARQGHPARHDHLTIALHWVMALLILAQLALGLWMVDLPKDSTGARAGWFNLHKSLGIMLLALAAIRLAHLLKRLHQGRRLPAPSASPLLNEAARFTHAMLYLLMLTVPLAGLLGSVWSKYPIRFFGLPLPRLAAPWDSAKAAMDTLHHNGSTALMALLVLHVLGFALHQFVWRDQLIQRMR
jgi:cytochrome b561